MSATTSKWHCIAISDEGEVDVYHPDSCRWSTTFHPRLVNSQGDVISEPWYQQEYECDVANELREWGLDGPVLPSEPGFYWVQLEHITYPGGPWGPTEYDTGSNWVVVERPRFIIEPMTDGPDA